MSDTTEEGNGLRFGGGKPKAHDTPLFIRATEPIYKKISPTINKMGTALFGEQPYGREAARRHHEKEMELARQYRQAEMLKRFGE